MDLPLEARGVTVRFGDFTAVESVTFDIARGKIVGIAGPNGSGKTTLLKAIYGAQQIVDGTVNIEGKPLSRMGTKQVARKLAVVSQFEDSGERMRVADLVMLGRAPHRRDIEGYSRQDHRIVADALAAVGLSGIADRYVHTLSGGERQRILIARALAQRCDLVLMDEPTNHLDIRYQHQIMTLVREVVETAVIVLHDLNIVSRYCDEVLVLRRGELVTSGAPSEVLTAELIAEIWEARALEVDDGGVKQFVFQGAARGDPGPGETSSGVDGGARPGGRPGR